MDPTHNVDYERFCCWSFPVLLLCTWIYNCLNFLSSSLVLSVLVNCEQSISSIRSVFAKPNNQWKMYTFSSYSYTLISLYTWICVPNYYFAKICAKTCAHILVKFGCSWHFWGFSGDLGGFWVLVSYDIWPFGSWKDHHMAQSDQIWFKMLHMGHGWSSHVSGWSTYVLYILDPINRFLGLSKVITGLFLLM